MAQMYNKSGAFSDLLNKINDSEIKEWKDLVDFKKDFKHRKEQIITERVQEVQAEIPKLKAEIEKLTEERDATKSGKTEELKAEINDLESKILHSQQDKNFVFELIRKLKNKIFQIQLNNLNKNFDSIIIDYIKDTEQRILSLQDSLDYTEKNIDAIAKSRAEEDLCRIERINRVIKEERNLVYGAAGKLKSYKKNIMIFSQNTLKRK